MCNMTLSPIESERCLVVDAVALMGGNEYLIQQMIDRLIDTGFRYRDTGFRYRDIYFRYRDTGLRNKDTGFWYRNSGLRYRDM